MGKLQNEDFKTEAELTGAGGTASQLLNDSKIWLTGLSKTLDDAITAGDLSSGGGLTPTASKTSAYNAVNGDFVLCDSSGGTFAVTLPTATSGHQVGIRKTDTSVVAVTVVGTVNGVSGDRLDTQNETIIYVADGTNWHQLARSVPSVWTSYTPTGSWTTNTTYTGKWKREGNFMYVDVYVQLAGAPDAVSLNIDIPLGLSIETSGLAHGGAGNGTILSTLDINDAGNSNYGGILRYNSTTTVRAMVFRSDTTFLTLASVNATNPVTLDSGDEIFIHFRVPIANWK